MKYMVEFQETLSYNVWIDADSEEDAEEKAQNMLTSGELVNIEDKAEGQPDELGFEFVQVLYSEDELVKH